jgi:hypothetical protein
MDIKYEIIRGQRIQNQLDEVKELLERSTFTALQQNSKNKVPTSSGRANAAIASNINIGKMDIVPYVGTRVLDIKGAAQNTNSQTKGQASSMHYPKIIFNNVEFEESDQPSNVTFRASDGNEYHVVPINLSQNTVRVYCDCLDFKWRFQHYNVSDRSAAIPKSPKPYQSKTDRGPVNPSKVPGVCKHLIALVDVLKKSALVR